MRLKVYTSEDIHHYIKKRKGEKKYGERVHYTTDPLGDPFAQLRESKAEYVLLGIPEALGGQVNSEKKRCCIGMGSYIKHAFEHPAK